APQMSDASTPPARRAVQVSAVVVVFPCVPAIATTRSPRESSRQASSRFHTSTPASSAAFTSTFASPYALERSTTSAPLTFAASNERYTVAPSRASASESGQLTVSVPLILFLRERRRRVTADIDVLPLQTQCIRTTR